MQRKKLFLSQTIWRNGRRVRIVVFDYDGTLTIDGRAAKRYRLVFAAKLAQALGEPPAVILAEIIRREANVLAHPERYAWRPKGRAVSPAAGILIRMTAVAQEMLEERGLFQGNLKARHRFIQDLYEASYPVYKTTHRAGMLQVMNRLRRAGVEVYIVSNSDPTKVWKKIQREFGRRARWLKDRIIGWAEKFTVGSRPLDLPVSLRIPGLDRPAYLRRPRYDRIIRSILRRHQASYDELAVVGDIPELDHLMLLAQGTWAILLATRETPGYELAYFARHARTGIIRRLRQLIQLFAT